MLLKGPFTHLVKAGGQEYISSKYVGLQAEGDPGERFPKIVGAADLVKAPAVGNFAFSGARTAQILEDTMRVKVAELEKHEQGGCSVIKRV